MGPILPLVQRPPVSNSGDDLNHLLYVPLADASVQSENKGKMHITMAYEI